jgi:hypothetical protein
VIAGLIAIYVLAGCILLVAYHYHSAGQRIDAGSVLQILGIGGDGISVGTLILSASSDC